MQTHEQNLNDLINALKTSSAYRQEQERFWRLQATGGYMPLVKEDVSEKATQWH